MRIDEIRDELSYLTGWFSNFYTIHEQKYNRLIALGMTESNPQEKLLELYEEAEAKRARIQELEKEMQDEEN